MSMESHPVLEWLGEHPEPISHTTCHFLLAWVRDEEAEDDTPIRSVVREWATSYAERWSQHPTGRQAVLLVALLDEVEAERDGA